MNPDSPAGGRILACCRASLREADILRFWLEYYRPHVDALLVTALLEPGDDAAELERLCRAAGALLVMDGREQFHCPQSMVALQKAVMLSPADWVLHADSDELLHELPVLRRILAQMEQEGADHAVAWMADRLAPGGKLAGLAGLHKVADLEAAFPVRAALTEKLARGCSYKVCVSRWPFTGSIHTPQRGQNKKGSRRLTLEHFKWRTGLEDRLRKRVRDHHAASLHWGNESERLLAELKTYGRFRAERWLAPRCRRIPGGMDYEDIYRDAILAACDGALFVEVGVKQGRSLCFLAEMMLACGRQFRIHGVNPAPPDGARVNLRRQGMLDYINLVDAPGPAAACSYEDDSLDLVWLHDVESPSSMMDDCRVWWPKIRPGGILAGPRGDHPCVGPAVADACFPPATLTSQGTSFIARKPAFPPPPSYALK